MEGGKWVKCGKEERAGRVGSRERRLCNGLEGLNGEERSNDEKDNIGRSRVSFTESRLERLDGRRMRRKRIKEKKEEKYRRGEGGGRRGKLEQGERTRVGVDNSLGIVLDELWNS